MFGLRMAPVAPPEARRRALEALELVHLPGGRPASGPALGRPEAAGGAGARARQPTRGAAARRAARRARPEAAQGDAGRAQAAPAAGGHHLRLRDARPGGGAHDGRPDRGDVGGPALQVGTPTRSTSAPRAASSPTSSARPTSSRACSRRASPAPRVRGRSAWCASPTAPRCEAVLRDPEALGRRHPPAVAVRPEKIGLHPAAGEATTGANGAAPMSELRGRVVEAHYIGTDTRYRVRMRGPASELVVRVQNQHAGFDGMLGAGHRGRRPLAHRPRLGAGMKGGAPVGIPILDVAGTPAEMGAAHGAVPRDALRAFAEERVHLAGQPAWTGRSLSRAQVLALGEACLDGPSRLRARPRRRARRHGRGGRPHLRRGPDRQRLHRLRRHGARRRAGAASAAPVPEEAMDCTAFLVPARADRRRHGAVRPDVGHARDGGRARDRAARGAARRPGLRRVHDGRLRRHDRHERARRLRRDQQPQRRRRRVGVTWPFVVRKALQQRDLDGRCAASRRRGSRARTTTCCSTPRAAAPTSRPPPPAPSSPTSPTTRSCTRTTAWRTATRRRRASARGGRRGEQRAAAGAGGGAARARDLTPDDLRP
jgi:hypothetical protein